MYKRECNPLCQRSPTSTTSQLSALVSRSTTHQRLWLSTFARPVPAHLRPTLRFRSLGLSLSHSLHLNKISSAPTLPVTRSRSTSSTSTIALSLSLSRPLLLLSRSSPSRALSLSLSLSPTRALPLRSLSLSLSHSYSRAIFLNPSLQVRAFRARVLAADIASQRWPFLAALRGSHRRTNASLTPTGALRRRTPGRSW